MPTVAAFNPFIVSTDVRKADPKTRKLIRSHVMLGKNRGKRRPTTTKSSPVDTISTAATNDSTPTSSSSDDDVRSTIPVKVGHEYSLIKLAADVEPPLLHGVLKFASLSKRALFPLEPCINFPHHSKTQWVAPISTDRLFCHAAVFVSQIAFNLPSTQTSNLSPSSTTRGSQHFGHTVKLLRLRLEEAEAAATTDTTLMVIVMLAMSALLTGQTETARGHLAGVRRIVEMRGGFGSFGGAVKLLIEVLRCDIGLALSTGLPPLFFHRPVEGPLDVCCSVRRTPQQRSKTFENLIPGLDANLVHIWHSLRTFTKQVNTASKTGGRLSEQLFLDSMASTAYPPLNLRYASGTISETCRLGLLAFCSNVFLQWQGMNHKFQALPSMYRQSLLGLSRSGDHVPPQALLWLLTMGGIALFTGEEDRLWLVPWLRDTVDECSGVERWDDVRGEMKKFSWVDFIHDEPGERLYAEAMSLDIPVIN